MLKYIISVLHRILQARFPNGSLTDIHYTLFSGRNSWAVEKQYTDYNPDDEIRPLHGISDCENIYHIKHDFLRLGKQTEQSPWASSPNSQKAKT